MEAGEVPEPFWTFWRRDKSLVPDGDITLDYLAHRLIDPNNYIYKVDRSCYISNVQLQFSFVHSRNYWTLLSHVS
jgi:hypothetical protein